MKKTLSTFAEQMEASLVQTINELLHESDGHSLAAAKATRLAYKTGKREDHTAAMNAHLTARGSDFPPQPPKGSQFQPNVDRWHHHDKQAKMHKAELAH
jgi:hypothetical protein